jgi:hypothetical protein
VSARAGRITKRALSIALVHLSKPWSLQVLLPTRFLTLMGHWIASITLVLDRVRSCAVEAPAELAQALPTEMKLCRSWSPPVILEVRKTARHSTSRSVS